MKTLYEAIRGSILGDIEDTIADGDSIAPEIAINMIDSDLRKYFNISNSTENPFKYEKIDNKWRLTVNTGTESAKKRIQITGDVRLKDVLDVPVDTLKIFNILDIYSNDISNDICNNIEASVIHINSININNVNLKTGQRDFSSYFPNISINSGKKSASLSNCNIEIDYSKSSTAEFIFHGDIPVFNNVYSNSVRRLLVTDKPSIIFDLNNISADIWNNSAWKNLFEFGYDLSFSTNVDNTFSDSLTIKNMKTIKKLISSKDFYSRTFDMWPYRLKRNAKLSDFIDISKFNDLNTLDVYDSKMGVVFINTKNTILMNNYIKSYYPDMLKLTWQNLKGHAKSDIINNIPVTSDGWAVIIFRR